MPKPKYAPDPRNKETLAQKYVRMQALMEQYQKLYQQEQAKNFHGQFEAKMQLAIAAAEQRGRADVAEWITRANKQKEQIENLNATAHRLCDRIELMGKEIIARNTQIARLKRKARKVEVTREREPLITVKFKRAMPTHLL